MFLRFVGVESKRNADHAGEGVAVKLLHRAAEARQMRQGGYRLS